jgi:23S rRNA (cytosine1962-C5)-methyltransferase
VMESLSRARERYDLVVVDPPSFASKQADVTGALRAYGRLTELAVPLVRSGGTLFQASCSSRVPVDRFVDRVRRSAVAAGVELQVDEVTGHPVDHPVGFPEGAYLKAVLATVER